LDDQTELNRLQGVVDDETSNNASAWDTFNNHMQMISNPPACPGLPGRTMPQLDVFFEKSEYSIWFAHNEAAYAAARAKYVAADAALAAAIEAYNIQKAIRDTQYCDWKTELEAACASFDACFAEKSDDFNKRLVPRVQSDMNSRIEALKAGETLVHQIKFLLADVANQETPDIDTSRYELDFPILPPKGECDLSVLDDAKWVPTPECGSTVGAYAGTYEVWYRGAKRSNIMTIDCNNAVSGNSGNELIQFDDIASKCVFDRDAEATMFIPNLHGRGKFECLRPDGANIVGNHYTGPTSFWGTIEYRRISSFRCQAEPPKPKLPGSSAGKYEVWYRGAKRSNTMTIDCNDAVSGNAGNELIQFNDIASKCVFDRDAEATMFIPNLHGRGKFECLRKVGDKILGNHYTGPTSFWGTIEYRPIAGSLHGCSD